MSDEDRLYRHLNSAILALQHIEQTAADLLAKQKQGELDPEYLRRELGYLRRMAEYTRAIITDRSPYETDT